MTSVPLISVVMPAYNEDATLPSIIADLIFELKDLDYEIVVVDDGSQDHTWAVIEELAQKEHRVRGVRFSRNFGHQCALLAGLLTAKGKAVVSLDSDGQHPPWLIQTMIQKWQAGSPVVQAIRRDNKSAGLIKEGASRLFYLTFSWLAGTSVSAGSADFRLLDRQIVNLILKHPRSAMFLRGFIPWTGFQIEYVEYAAADRIAGVTKYSLSRMIALARQGILRFSLKPLRLASLLGALTCAGSLVYLAYIVYIRLFGNSDPVPGWASVAGLLALLGGIQLLIMGVLGEYIGMIFEAEQSRPLFVIAEETAASTDSDSVDTDYDSVEMG